MARYVEGHDLISEEANVKVKSVCAWLITDQGEGHLA